MYNAPVRATTIKLIAIVLLAGALRVLAAFVVQDAHVSWDYEYEIIAQNLVQGNGYAYDFYGLSESQPTSFQPPVYPLFLAGLARLAPGSTVGLAAMQILLSLLSIVLLFKLTCAQGGSTAQGLLAALMLAAYPPINLHAVIPSSVTLEILFLLAGVLCTLRSQQSSLPAWPLAAGLSFGMASLTRSPWLVAIPIAMLWTSWQTEHAGLRRWRTALLLLGAALLTFFPWALHNRQV
ncbi:MAG: phospholipid carrier-dependent glycosyltransferase, partial [Lysobacterales bacterium]